MRPPLPRVWSPAGTPSDEVAAAMRQVAAPSGADLANEAARVLSERLTKER